MGTGLTWSERDRYALLTGDENWPPSAEDPIMLEQVARDAPPSHSGRSRSSQSGSPPGGVGLVAVGLALHVEGTAATGLRPALETPARTRA